jgi:hypothetical protein
LKYPEKSSFFAIQIKKLQKKQNKKTWVFFQFLFF